MSIFGLAAPNTMPSDSRVLYFYRPTYLAAAFMMKAVLLNPDLLDEACFPGTDLIDSPKMVRDTLASCLLGCTGRGFDGAGHLPVRDCVRLFEDAGASEFIEKYPELCPEFASLYREKRHLWKAVPSIRRKHGTTTADDPPLTVSLLPR